MSASPYYTQDTDYQITPGYKPDSTNCISCPCTCILEWNLSITDTIGEPTFCPSWRGVPNSGASGIFPVSVVLHNRAVEHNVAAVFRAILCCMLAGKAKQRLVLQVTALI